MCNSGASGGNSSAANRPDAERIQWFPQMEHVLAAPTNRGHLLSARGHAARPMLTLRRRAQMQTLPNLPPSIAPEVFAKLCASLAPPLRALDHSELAAAAT
jgi:hypothetical protein